MGEKFVKAVRKTGTSLAVTLPPEVLRLLKIKEGDLVRVEIERINAK